VSVRKEIWTNVREDVAWVVVDETVKGTEKRPLTRPELIFDGADVISSKNSESGVEI
jgi:hypothetical protein